MDLQDTASYAQILDSRDRIAGDIGSNWYQRAQELGPLGSALRSPQSSKSKSTTFGDVLRTAIGSALGYGLGRGASSVMGLSEDSSSNVAFTGAMMGGLMGLTKSASERQLAFRTAFIKAAIDRGHFKTAFINTLILNPLSSLAHTASRIAENAGAIAGSADAPDDVDADVVRNKVETELLRQELKRVKALRQNQLLKQVLAKRTE